ncbi:MAG: GNAT family N-acetyltransferase, partial [Pseudonocardiaceae bacterium]
ALLATLASECIEHGYSRLEWSVPDWNTSAMRLYERLDAEPMADKTEYRLSGPALATTALLAPGAIT